MIRLDNVNRPSFRKTLSSERVYVTRIRHYYNSWVLVRGAHVFTIQWALIAVVRRLRELQQHMIASNRNDNCERTYNKHVHLRLIRTMLVLSACAESHNNNDNN